MEDTETPVADETPEADIPETPPADAAAAPAPEAAAPTPPADASVANPDLPPPSGIPGSFQDRQAQDAEYQSDLAKGAVTPKTYKDFFGQGTLGKAGAYFGLLVSGLGSGLSHQPNAVTDMYDKMIDRDLDAQKAGKVNAGNLYQMSLQHADVLTRTARAYWENKRDQASAAKDAKGVEVANAQLGLIHAETKEHAAAAAKTTAANSMYAEFMGLTQGIPPGATQTGAMNLLQNDIGPKLANSNAMTNQRASTRISAIQRLSGAAPTNDQQMNADVAMAQAIGLGEVGKNAQDRYVPGIGIGTTPLAPADRDKLRDFANFRNKLEDFASWSDAHRGSVNPADYVEGKTKAYLLNDAYRKMSGGGVYKESEADFIKGIVPGNATSATDLLNNLMNKPKLDALRNDVNSQFGTHLTSLGFNPGMVPINSQALGTGSIAWRNPKTAGPSETKTTDTAQTKDSDEGGIETRMWKPKGASEPIKITYHPKDGTWTDESGKVIHTEKKPQKKAAK